MLMTGCSLTGNMLSGAFVGIAPVSSVMPAPEASAAPDTEDTSENAQTAPQQKGFDFVEIIAKKKLGQELTAEEIKLFADGAAKGTIPDYQLAAMLMAIRLNGMTAAETTNLTLAMRDSGDVLNLNMGSLTPVDKHSTGGVSDGTSLVIAPLVAACGAYVPMVSGRGLGHTGGTLDKLESIPGLSVSLSNQEFIDQVKNKGLAIIGQTDNVAPADKKLYALRDVTSTVDSIPLIAASILSKKLASGTQALVLDVKTGSGALLQNLDDSRQLASTMVDICSGAGVKSIALVTDMNQPLGTHVGNSLEVEYAIKILSGEEKGDYYDLCMKLSSAMLIICGRADSREDAEKQLAHAIESGAALEKFREMIKAQGGDPKVCDDVSLLPHAPIVRDVYMGQSGYIEKMDCTALGNASRLLGAGRLNMEDSIDFGVGYILPVRIGDNVSEDTLLCTIYANTEQDAETAEKNIRAAIQLSDKPVEKPKLIYEVIAGK